MNKNTAAYMAKKIIPFHMLMYCFAFSLHAMPENLAELKKPVSNEALYELIESVKDNEHVTVTTEGYSVKNNPLLLIRMHHSDSPRWRVFFFAQQHGNETSGKDALAYLIRDYAQHPEKLPKDVDLYILPLVNPDGASDYSRRNANHSDLNRDHLLLTQPETQFLHQLGRRIMPHIVVDGHEFKRDTGDYTANGWREWPVIMMGTANSPLYSDELYNIGVRWIEDVGVTMAVNEHNYERYFLAYYPPNGELRYSTMESDDARNSFGVFYHALSFIIESGVYRTTENPFADIAERTLAYYRIYEQFIHDARHRESDLRAIEAARSGKPKNFTPTNYFWATEPGITKTSKAVEIETGKTVEFVAPNFMTRRTVKKYVATAEAYAIPTSKVSLMVPLLDKHGLDYEILAREMVFDAEKCRLERIENETDSVYQRYGGRQIVNCERSTETVLPKGSLLISTQHNRGNQVIALLEPQMLYGLLRYPQYQPLLDDDSSINIYRVMD